MQLKELQSFGSQLQALSAQRHQRADDDYTRGMECLNRAHDSHFTDKASLLEASQKLYLAIQKNRRDPKAYVSMAFLLTLLGELDKAQPYLFEALRLDPQNETAQDLLKSLSELKNMSLSASDEFDLLEASQEVKAVEDYDELYETVQKLIHNNIRQLMQERHDPEPTTDQTTLQTIQQKQYSLEELQQRIHAQLKIVEEEIDCQDLYAQMRPLDMLVRKYKRASDLSLEFGNILANLGHHRQTAEQLMIQTTRHHNPDDPELQRLLDDFDALADQIDDLSNQKINTSQIEAAYEVVAVMIGNLQELFDDA